MGHIFTEIELSNPREQQLTSIKVNALADTGALIGKRFMIGARITIDTNILMYSIQII